MKISSSSVINNIEWGKKPNIEKKKGKFVSWNRGIESDKEPLAI